MKSLLKNNITTFLIIYIIVLLLLNVLPINGKESALNNNYTLNIRWDYLGHFFAYGILGILGILYSLMKKTNIWLTILTLLIFSTGAEFLQMFIPYRTYNINDLVANSLGVGLGMFGMYIYQLFKVFPN
jgi:VanZ family protein